ncbi:hypothetical protein ABZT03_04035 [Streptomyces sp. NPDC005574]|uniref:hypothetical protein n=1 Tax=Streptomyces sp. NPDC005574 TaxID=3156891 RepID=UPI0033A43C57
MRLLGEPVVDIALMLDHAKRELETRSDAAVESSLTQHAYSFSREGTAVSLATEWPLARAELTWFELQQLTDQAKAEAFRLITTAHPELRDNAWLRDTVGAPSTA